MRLVSIKMASICLKTIFIAASVLIVSARGDEVSSRGLATRPQNTAVFIDQVDITTTLFCEGTLSPPGSRISWTEFITNSVGNPLSDGNQILNGPNSARYAIDNNGTDTIYNLVVSPTQLNDGGAYRCIDVNDASIPGYAQFIVIRGPINCTTNLPDDGFVLESMYYTYECWLTYQGNVAPKAWWTGTSSGFTWATITTNTTVWAGMSMNMTRQLDGASFQLTFNFTQEGFVQPNYASNVPTWSYTVQTPALTVEWGPKNLTYYPRQPNYDIGTEIYCSSDANPEANYYWQSLTTNERWDGNLLYAYDPLIGTNTYRCHAQNVIGHNVYFDDIFVNITVNPRPTEPPATSPPTTTTPPPEWGQCADLTGRWTATRPHKVDLCISIDNNNGGRMIGLMRNDTDPYFVDVRGTVIPYKFDEIGFIGVWPVNIGTLAFTGVCSSCLGVETLMVTGIGRTINDFNTCSDFGALRQITFYEFSRTGPPCNSRDGTFVL